MSSGQGSNDPPKGGNNPAPVAKPKPDVKEPQGGSK